MIPPSTLDFNLDFTVPVPAVQHCRDPGEKSKKTRNDVKLDRFESDKEKAEAMRCDLHSNGGSEIQEYSS